MAHEMEQQIAIPPSADAFHPKLLAVMEQAFKKTNVSFREVEMSKFSDQSPLIKVEEADRTLLIFWYGGENWKDAYTEIGHIGSAFTMDIDEAGPNTQELGMYFPFMESRQDQKTRKPIPESTRMSIVKNQGVNTIALAREIGLVARPAWVVTQDLHSHLLAKQLVEESAIRPEGPLKHINLTATPLFADRIVDLIHDPEEWVIGGTDLGDLNRQVPLQRYLKKTYGLDIPLVVIEKRRISTEQGTNSTVITNLLYGDPKGKRILLVDDVISSGGTLHANAKLYKQLQACELHIFAPQALFVPETFYSTVRSVLADPYVASITVTDVLPIKKRLGTLRDIPYVGKGENKKVVQVIDISPMFTSVVKALMKANSSEERRAALQPYVWDMQDPRDLYQEITGMRLPEAEIGGIYRGQGEYELFSSDHSSDGNHGEIFDRVAAD